jgi:hypothetical protein
MLSSAIDRSDSLRTSGVPGKSVFGNIVLNAERKAERQQTGLEASIVQLLPVRGGAGVEVAIRF